MSPIGNAILGLVFLALGTVSTLLMFHLWGYPFDEKTYKSEAPPSLMLLHRLIGYVYLAIYLYFLSQMVPRLWEYQIELPARSVAHLTLGMAIGAILLVKISVVRFFKHLESKLVPFLGVSLLICTILLMGLSIPFAFREAYLRAATVNGPISDPKNLGRVREQLLLAGLRDDGDRKRLASPKSLRAGQAVLLKECVQCHDLRTVLARPRTPENWRETVTRMAERSNLVKPISERQQWEVISYLVAITPELQKVAGQRRDEERRSEASQMAVKSLADQRARSGETAPAPYDPEKGRQLFEMRCSLCHPHEVVAKSPPRSESAVRALVERMVQNGASATDQEFANIIRYLTDAYAK
jgi:mono/diheme cytochrome c family protein